MLNITTEASQETFQETSVLILYIVNFFIVRVVGSALHSPGPLSAYARTVQCNNSDSLKQLSVPIGS